MDLDYSDFSLVVRQYKMGDNDCSTFTDLSLEITLKISDHLCTRDVISLAFCAKGFACFLAARVLKDALCREYDNECSLIN
jgi:hypothetical protein